MLVTNPRDIVFMCPGENAERSYYTVDEGYKILIGPEGEDTYSQSERIRLGVGTQPRFLLKGEGWGGRKVADAIVWEGGGKVKNLGEAKINFAQGF